MIVLQLSKLPSLHEQKKGGAVSARSHPFLRLLSIALV